MKPETSDCLEQAHRLLGRADRMLAVELSEDAARNAYVACFHLAQALIMERTGKVSKTHRGVQTEFLRLTEADRRVDAELRRFLSRAYTFKSVADYFTGEDAITSAEDAAAAVATAKRFVGHFEALVSAPA